jgi:hypothetical protein
VTSHDLDLLATDPRDDDARDSVRHVLVAAGLSLALWFVPYVGLVLYPIRLFVTYVHEICHALAAFVTLGSALEIEIFADASGLTYTLGGVGLVVSSAGYVGTPLFGALLLLLSSRRAAVRPALAATGGALLLAAVALGGNWLAWLAGVGLGAALVALGVKAKASTARFALSFLAIQCMLNALWDLKSLMWLSIASPVATDARNMAEATGGLVPAAAWTVLWAGIALAILAIAIHNYYSLTVRRPRGAGQPS